VKGALTELTDLKRISVLKPVFGSEVELIDEDGSAAPYMIAAEYQLGETMYAGLQTASMKKDDEVAFFRIVLHEDAEPELESIDDEDEWELAAEAFDDLQFSSDERP
jgi:hypothetical protein